MQDLVRQIEDCRLCRDRFAGTATAHVPRPVVWASKTARVLIAGQAPGARVHQSGRPFTDPSGDRLRDWLGIDADAFYDRTKIAIVPMAFCFPGYDAKGADLPPPAICRRTWHPRLMPELDKVEMKILVGGYAQKWHLGVRTNLTDTVSAWRDFMPNAFPLPHPSWRNTGWLKKNPWFEADLLPELRRRLREVLDAN